MSTAADSLQRQRALLEHTMAIMACSDVQEVGMLVWHELSISVEFLHSMT